MKIVEGFLKAKTMLSRQATGEVFGSDEREQAVRRIIDGVRRRGDAAIFDYTLEFDDVRLNSLEVSKEQIADAYKDVDAELVSALRLAAGRITEFHVRQRESILNGSVAQGVGWKVNPLRSVGVYAPGGTASYPSTVLMTAVPARVAGVGEVILVTPPGSGGSIPPLTLVAADIAKVDRVFAIGGAQAIAALAYGTESVPGVDKICGPGNIFVVLAKKLVYGVVGIDGLQGPSEVLIIADETADVGYCASDLLAQAEHDSLASAVLVTNSRRLADEINRELEKQLEVLPRRGIAAESLEKGGLIAVVGSIDEAVEMANLYAPEHLCLIVKDADSCIERLSNAGCIVTGDRATVVLGDYVAGPSHVLPTGGTARFTSPLNVSDFLKLTSIIDIDDAAIKKLGPAASIIARAEGLDAHARAVEKRLKAPGGGG